MAMVRKIKNKKVVEEEKPTKFECYDCWWYVDKNLPDTTGCGECRRFPPTAIKKCEQPYAMGYYPVIGDASEICGEFKLFDRNIRKLDHDIYG